MQPNNHCQTRRTFLSDVGMGFPGMALGSMLAGDPLSGEALAKTAAKIAPKAKSVIWLFMVGGVSHMEGFDPKPALNKYAGKSLAETPVKDPFESPFVKKNFRPVGAVNLLRSFRQVILPMQIGYQKRGQSGIEVSDWWPHVGECIDDIAVVRSMWTSDNNHTAQLQFHTGRHFSDGAFPTIGSWAHYGLGRLNDNLPQFIALGTPIKAGYGPQVQSANYLGAEYDAVHLDEKEPLPFGNPAGRTSREEQRLNAEMISRLNRLTAAEYPDDRALQARIKSYELAFRMQMSIPDVFDTSDETARTLEAYGDGFGRQLVAARRFVEKGVRFVQIYHGADDPDPAGGWDAHFFLKENHTKNCLSADKPIATLLKDLKQRGMLDETLVVWASEFGRTPGTEESNGRDHHPFGFSVWMAGGGIKGGITHGTTDELGMLADENPHYVTDIHATVLTQLGLDPHAMEIPGRKRLDFEFGRPIREIIA